jgi:hypothetical protein
MTELEKCPDCDGGFITVLTPCMGCDPDSEEHQHAPPEKVKCRTCHGDGKLSPLAAAVRKARGAPPPVPLHYI